MNLRRGHSVPRTQRSAFSAFTRVFDALWRCAAEPGSISQRRYGSRLCGAARRALHRVRDTRGARAAVVICPSGSFVSSPLCKNISVSAPPKSHLQLSASHPTTGAYRDRHDAGRDAVDAAAFCARKVAGQASRLVSDHKASGRTMLLRTAKSCGPDAPTLASSSRRSSRPYRARTKP